MLAQLSQIDNVKAIYCLVRGDSTENATARVISTLASKKLVTPANMSKVICLPSDLSRSDLGLDSSTLETLQRSLKTVIHCAWAVNFNLGVQSFESQHIRGTFNLLNLCLTVSTPLPAKLFFCSSISAAAGTPLPAVIPEMYITNLSHAQNMGYARSKLVTETIIKAAADQTGMCAQVLRVGQIVGDTSMGIWNSTEAISLMIRSAVTIGALPVLDEVRLRSLQVSVGIDRHLDTFLATCRHCRRSSIRPCWFQPLFRSNFFYCRTLSTIQYCVSRPKLPSFPLDQRSSPRLTKSRIRIQGCISTRMGPPVA